MAKQDLIDYIISTRESGYNDEQIKKALKNKGWDDISINEAFDKLKEGIPEAPSKPDIDIDDSNAHERKFNVMAILSFALSFFVPLVGLILGIIALKQIKISSEKGKGFAIAAIILNVLYIVIFVAILGIAFIAYFGVMDPSNMLPERCQSQAGMDCIDTARITNSGVTMALRNNIGYEVIINEIQGSVCQGPSGGISGTSGDIITNYEFVPFEVKNNEVFRLKIDCSLVSGKDFSDTFNVEYENVETSLTHIVPVNIRGKVN